MNAAAEELAFYTPHRWHLGRWWCSTETELRALGIVDPYGPKPSAWCWLRGQSYATTATRPRLWRTWHHPGGATRTVLTMDRPA